MIKNLLVLTLLIRFLPGNAQIEKVYQSRYPLNDILSLNADTIYACGYRGIVVSTTNGGVVWQRDSLPTKFNLKSIVVSQKGIGYVAGDSGTVFRSADFGKNWVNANVLKDYNLSDLQLVNDSMAYVKIEGKGILATRDTGKTWQQVLMRPNLINHLYLGNTGYVSGWDKLYRTINAGKTWDSTSFENGVYVVRVTEKEVQIYSNNSGLYYSTDSCKTFNQIPYLFGFNFHADGNLQFIDDNYGIWVNWAWCTCGPGIPPHISFGITSDNGRTWEHETGYVLNYGTKFSFANKDTGYFIANSNSIIKTFNGRFGDFVSNVPLISDNAYQVYPNPVTGTSAISFPEGTDKIILQLYNSVGQMVENLPLSSENNTISKGDKPTGIYVYKILRQGQVVSTGKLIVQ